MLDVTRVFNPDNMSCGEEGSRLELVPRLLPILTKFAPILGSEFFLTVCEKAEEKTHSARGVGSASFRRNEAKAMVVAHVVDLLRYHGVLLVSENCVLLHGAVEEDPGGGPDGASTRQRTFVSGSFARWRSARRRADCAAHGHSAAGAPASGRAAQQVYNALISLRRFPG